MGCAYFNRTLSIYSPSKGEQDENKPLTTTYVTVSKYATIHLLFYESTSARASTVLSMTCSIRVW